VLVTNAVEILGGRLKLGQGVVGSVLAAVGTAPPETMIPLVVDETQPLVTLYNA
jgi:cation:H+ antiporter